MINVVRQFFGIGLVWYKLESLFTKYSFFWILFRPLSLFALLTIVAFGTTFPIGGRSAGQLVVGVFLFCFFDTLMSRFAKSLYFAPKIKELNQIGTIKIVYSTTLPSLLDQISPLTISFLTLITLNFNLDLEFFESLTSTLVILLLALSWAVPFSHFGRNFRDFRNVYPFFSRGLLFTSPLIFDFRWQNEFVYGIQSLNPLYFPAGILYGLPSEDLTRSTLSFFLLVGIGLFLTFKWRNTKSTRFNRKDF